MRKIEEYILNVAKIFGEGRQRRAQQQQYNLLVNHSHIEPKLAVLRIALEQKGHISGPVILKYQSLTKQFPEPRVVVFDGETETDPILESFSVKNGVMKLTFLNGETKSYKLK